MRLRQAKKVITRIYGDKTWRKFEHSKMRWSAFMHMLYTRDQIMRACYILYAKDRATFNAKECSFLFVAENGAINNE